MDNKKYLNELEVLLKEKGESQENINAAMEYSKNLLALKMPVIFDKEHFAALVGVTVHEISTMMALLEKVYYTKKEIPKKSGGVRELMIPAMRLRMIQQWILKNILYSIPVSRYAMGFTKRRSIVTNAKMHVGKECVVNMDMKDFFPTITQEQVFKVFYYYGYTIGVSYMLSRLCTVDGKLPQGAPTSPYLSNIICLKLDKRLSNLARSYEAEYSRYADDITFSGCYGVQNIILPASKIIENEGFGINNKKTRIAFKYEKQEVTGINVSGNKISVDKKYRKAFLQEIYYCKKYGPSDHLKYIGCNKRFYQEHLYGKAYFINMVDPKLGKKILELLDEIEWEK